MRTALIEHGLGDRIVLAVDRWLQGRRLPGSGGRSVPPVPGAAAGSGGPGSSSPTGVYPADGVEEGPHDAREQRLSGRLMRVNHAGEVAAQALYLGQSMFARDPGVRVALDTAAGEERAHLEWCRRRLTELGARPSRLDPVWWAGSFAIGAAAGAAGDAQSLGFVAETERQVVEHLARHLRRLPREDLRSRAICRRMMDGEQRHGTSAHEAGGRRLPAPARTMMRVAAGVMTATAFRL